MSNQNKANANDPLGIIGKKMKGFKFEDWKHNALNYATVMDNYIGSIGEIISYHNKFDSYRCQFGEYKYSYYPAELIKDYLVDTPQDNQQDTPQQLTLLEKFEQGWEIMELHNGFRIIDIAKTIKGRYFVKWSDGKIEQYDDLILNAVTCTPPKERKTVYVYLLTITGKCLTSEELLTSEFCKIIQTIHIEQNVEEWEVVNP